MGGAAAHLPAKSHVSPKGAPRFLALPILTGEALAHENEQNDRVELG